MNSKSMTEGNSFANGNGPGGGDSPLGGPCMDSWELDPQMRAAHWWTVQP